MYRRAKRGEPQAFIENIPDTDECVVWPFGQNEHGYGQLWWQGTLVRAHRLVLQLHSDEIGEGLDAAHGPCNNRLCLNPRHLSWKTRKENVADKLRDGTMVRGSKVHTAKLTEAEVREIRAATGPQKIIAERFRISTTQVSDIKNGKSWAWLK